MIINEDDYLAHYGTPRRSGRYPWGSDQDGDAGSGRNMSLLGHIEEMKKKGLSDLEIAQGLGMSTTEYRNQKSIAKNEKKQADIGRAQSLKSRGYSNVAAAKEMGIPESSFRALLANDTKTRADILLSTSKMLKEEVDAKNYIDVGAGVEKHLGISKEKLSSAISLLKQEGYAVHPVNVKQLGTGLETRLKVLVPPGVTQKEAWLNRDHIQQISRVSTDGGRIYGHNDHEPLSVDPKRLSIRYKADGGGQADGVIYVRPGVDDLSLGKARYAQVRVKVGDSHYLKGMALYKEDLPAGIDLLFNTNKDDTGNKLDALKEIDKKDKELPFGAIVSQLVREPGTPQEHVYSAMNIVNEEGSWTKWSKSIASQVLSKQSPSLAREQLNKTYEARQREFEEINSLTNPSVKKKLLESFANKSDAAAVHLKAAAISSRQGWHVILPIEDIKPTEVYAPNYDDGERVALIRYPHGGTFEIPELTVNNRHRSSRRTLGDAPDAIGIHPSVAERLSGADFDGDTVIVIPNRSGKIKSTPALEDLKGFDPRSAYPAYEGMVGIKDLKDPGATEQRLMGEVSNLITDMTIRGASRSELARAVKHSMVVIDAAKHNLDYKRSAREQGIAQLKKEYQIDPTNGESRGASTLISRAGSELRVPDRKLRRASQGGPIDPKTGAKVFEPTGKTVRGRDGTPRPKMIKTTKLAEATDAHSLSSGTRWEFLYAEHSNSLKSLANRARLEASKTPPVKWSASAKTTYAKEVKELNSALHLAQLNAPRERQAQVIANAIAKAKRQANPGQDRDSLRKIDYQALAEARQRMGVGKKLIKITDKQWEAIQAGAISPSKLNDILNNADIDRVKELATPQHRTIMSSTKASQARSLLSAGHTRAEVARRLGVSLSTLDRSLKEVSIGG